MRKVNSLGNRLIALTLSVFMVLGMFPSGVVAVDNSSLYGVVESLTDGVTINEIGKDIKVSFAGNLNWVAADTTVGRNSDGWWIGLKVTAPETISIDTAKYTSGGQEKSFKDYNDSEDDANVQFIQLWSLVKEEYLRSANLTDGLSTYTWTFDWDGNGVFEQTMKLDIDADQTILYKDGSTQVYPAEDVGFGKLEMLTAGATVSGNESANVVASYTTDTAVAWVAADTSVGRYQDGWWAGMKITVPDGMTEEQLKEVQYMSGEAVKSFWTYKDSKEGDAAHFMTMWVPLNKLLTGNLEPYKYQFDWNNDGIFEQSVIMKVDPTKVTLTKDDVQVYPKLGTLTSLSGGEVTGSETGNATLLIEKAELPWSPADETVGRLEDGWWVGSKVTAPEGTDLTKIKFRRKTGTDSWTESMDYKPDEGSTMQLWGRITGEYLKTFEEQNRNLNYVWQFDWDGDGKFEQTVTMTVVPKDIKLKQEGFAFVKTQDTILFDEGLVYEIEAPVGNLSGEAPVYTVTNEDPANPVAKVNAAGTGLEILRAGQVTVTATVNKYFNPISTSFELIIDKGNLNTENFFDKGEKPEVTFKEGETFKNAVNGGRDDGVTYEIVQQLDLDKIALKEGEAVVSPVEGRNGEYQILRSGIVTVKATKAESANYKEAVCYYTLTVKRADQSFSITDDKVYYGVEKYTPDLEKNLQATSEGFGTGAYTLMVEENSIGASVKDNAIVFNAAQDKTGPVEIIVTKLADACYNECSNSFVLTVEYVQPPAYKIVDAQGKEVKPNANGWYNAQVYIQPAEDGWLISDENIRGNEVWGKDLPYGGEGDQTEAKFAFLRESDRAMTDLLSVEAYRRDDTAPTKLEIDYDADLTWPEALAKMFGFKKDTTSVTIKAEDALSGVAFLHYSIDGGKTVDPRNNIAFNGQNVAEYTFEIPAQYRNSIVFWAVDMADKTSQYSDGKTLVVDAITPEITVKYDEENTVKDAAGDIYAKGELELIFELKADNTDLAKTIRLTVNGNEEMLEWNPTSVENVQSATHLLPVNGDYEIAFLYEDYLERADDETLTVHTDDTKPVISVSYEPKKGNNNGLYFKEDRVATIMVTEHNFEAKNVTAKVGLQDVTTADIEKDLDESEKFGAIMTEYLRNDANWKYMDAEGNIIDTPENAVPDVRVAQYTFDQDAHYSFELDCSDIIGIIGNEVETYTAEAFVVDHEAPDGLEIEYSDGVPAEDFLTSFLSTITFGYYNPEKNVPLIVTLTAKDEIAGVDYFEWFYTREADASNINAESGSAENNNILYVSQMPEEEGVASYSASFEIDPQARGYITFRATDYAGNTYGVVKGNDDQWVADTDRINIVDTIAPGRVVTWHDAIVYDARTLADVKSFAEGDDVILYYQGEATVTIDVEEANFYGGDVKVYVTTDPTDLSNATDYSDEVVWSSASADAHQGVVTIEETDGDYYLVVTYTDRSLNEMVTYTSQRVVIDKTAPEISVEYYGGNDEQMSPVSVFSDWDNQEREYYDADRYATITITEKNFRADDVKVIVKAKDVTGADVKVGEITLEDVFADQGANRDQWTPYEALWRRYNNTYELKLEYTTDANYTFDVEYTDMAKNAQKEDYSPDYFTVDKVAPEHLEVKYDGVAYNTVWDNILNVITLGYYQATVGVTISAKDDTAGVWQMDYEYIKKDGSSEINMASESVTTENITRDGNVFSVKFNVPKEALAPNNQYNGIVTYSTTDRTMHESASEETRTMVVDDIAPTATISYNAPVKQLGNVSYYAGDINATIVINEANFFSEDVVVTVNDKPVAVSWSDNSVDVHTGTFTLSSDGDYVVKVTYTDRSTNKMEDYASNQLTIDTKAPVIQVSDVKHESANNGETISFTVQVTDRNIALENFKPTLSVLVKKDNGNNQYSFETETIDLGQARTSVNSNGDTVYTYTIENLEVDGFYSLVCEAVDHANHTISSINSTNNADENTIVETVNFSVNRDGSVFWITTEHTEGDEMIVDQLHGKYVNGEVIVRIHEINVDKVDDGKATIFTLNDGSSAEDIILDETNYKKNVSIGAGGWYQTDYTLDNSYFAKDGVYSINIITYDKATNSNVNTKSEEGTITFTVDRTKPVISANLTSRQIINDTQYKVYFQITELNLDAETIVVKYNGELVALENMGNNEYSFTVKEGLNQSVEITAVDLAGNAAELYKADPFTVSTNIFVRWYATGFWFWFPIIAVPLLIGLIILLIVLKKKKKER